MSELQKEIHELEKLRDDIVYKTAFGQMSFEEVSEKRCYIVRQSAELLKAEVERVTKLG